MRFIPSSLVLAAAAVVVPFFAGGCTQEISTQQLADTVGKPADVHFFADNAVYMGDKDGYRYVHVRDLFDCLTFLGERDYKIPASQWPMKHPMPLTCNANKWQDVSWMNGDGPAGVRQNIFLTLTPNFPESLPATQPVVLSTTADTSGVSPGNTAPATKSAVVAPTTQPSK